MKDMGKEVKLYTKALECYNGYPSIIDLFGLDVDTATAEEADKWMDTGGSILDRIRHRLVGFRKTHYQESYDMNFEPAVFTVDNVFLNGFWQSYKYFEAYNEIILNDFCFPPCPTEENRKYADMITESECAVSVHYRRGDYLTEINKKVFGNICTDEYYRSAISEMNRRYKNCTFFIFSNDKGIMDEVDIDGNCILVDCNDDSSGWCDMYLMSLCKHNIIANSSFSWWGAWLNRNEDKTVIAPHKWMNTRNMMDNCPPEWVRI
jgi:hypothetical protein